MEPTLTCCATLLAVYFILATSMFGVGLPSGLRLRVRVRASVGLPSTLRLRVRVRASVGLPSALRFRVRVRASVGLPSGLG